MRVRLLSAEAVWDLTHRATCRASEQGGGNVRVRLLRAEAVWEMTLGRRRRLTLLGQGSKQLPADCLLWQTAGVTALSSQPLDSCWQPVR